MREGEGALEIKIGRALKGLREVELTNRLYLKVEIQQLDCIKLCTVLSQCRQ